jgi:hypothetical protein
MALEIITGIATGLPDKLAALGIAVPDRLAEAVAAHRAALGYLGPDAEIDNLLDRCATVSAAEARQLMADIVRLEGERRTARGNARAAALNRFATRVIGAAQAVAPQLGIDAGPGFTAAAETYTNAYRTLPANWEQPTVLSRFDGQQFAAYGVCRDTAGVLNAHADLWTSLAELTGRKGRSLAYGGTEFARLGDDGNSLDAEALFAGGRRTLGSPLGKWAGMLDVAGAELHWWNSDAEHAAYVKSLPVYEVAYVRSETGIGNVPEARPVQR